ncbi:FkbM family methyltransferase [Pusillimonas sp. SM2304]|uniref:FkbM family methyltransferase n=1 Tax=Pusillimonas sp. SM2304 TaxID=3073241 RepID=UPI002875E9FE|nr:FkbM family methyltransferase [Pusillimonas sp. SM2304]MDS1141175.1 FkbM family methyltransferase [Pusillimonas sp. SM2304]
MTQSLLEHDLERTITLLSTEELERLEAMKQRFAPQFSEISDLLYKQLPEADQERLILWLAKRWAKIDRVPKEEHAEYDADIKRIWHYPYETQEFHGAAYKRLALAPQGYEGELLTHPWVLGIHDFLYDQYQHGDCRVQPGDTIIDAGAFVGDTAVLFHQAAKGDCHVHAFEILEENLRLMRYNLDANNIADKVDICSLALSDKSGDFVNIHAPTIQGATSIFGSSGEIQVETITLDDYVRQKRVERVDLIKMDIEGAERMALAGALDTIKRDRPRLAICVYHIWDDIIEIPRIIRASGVPYRYGFKWVKLNTGGEAVLLCTPESAVQ